MSNPTVPNPEKPDLNDDVFAYEGSGGLTQCISGFGRNAIENIGGDLDDNMPGGEKHTEARERLTWHIEELVRWCRHFNGELKKAKSVNADLLAACKEALKVVDDCYESTGHIKVAKSSAQRMAIEAAISAASGKDGKP